MLAEPFKLSHIIIVSKSAKLREMANLMGTLAVWARDELPRLYAGMAGVTHDGVAVTATKVKGLVDGVIAGVLALGIKVGVGGFPIDPYIVEVRESYFAEHESAVFDGEAPKLQTYPALVVRARAGAIRVIFGADPPYLHAAVGSRYDVLKLDDPSKAPVPVQRVFRKFRLDVKPPEGVGTVTFVVRSDMCSAMVVGGVEVRTPVNYDAFGVTVPISHADAVVFYTPLGAPFFAGWIEFGRAPMDFGALTKLPEELLAEPHVTVNAPDAFVDPEYYPPVGAVARQCLWHGGAKYLLQLDTAWACLGSLTVCRPLSFFPLRVLIAPHGSPSALTFAVGGLQDTACAHTVDAGTYVGDATSVVPDVLTTEQRAYVDDAVGEARLKCIHACSKL